MTPLGALYRAVRDRLRAGGSDTPELDSKRLLSHFLGIAPEDVLLKPDTPVHETSMLMDAVARREAGEPVSKITGTRGFYGMDFEVTRDVLDPRPDTETLVDAARRHLDGLGRRDVRILDLCTGSGCILAALLALYPAATGTGADISPDALEVAARNLRAHGLEARATLLRSDYVEGVDGTFDVMVSNPPYIPSGDIAALDAGVRLYDPLLALDGGADGLSPYRIVFPQIRRLLAEGGAAFFECGINQANDLVRLGQGCGLQVTGVLRDLGGVDRVVCLRA